jgi:glycosyltransferase involved in cell wall biosynthesis
MKGKPVKFTVVIPTYNRADLILETIDSVLEQTYRNFEVIVVDNCSTDNTESVLQELIKEARVRYIKHDRNYERSKSRNTGMIHASGDFVTFLDSDDFLYPSCLADAADFIEKNPEIRFFHSMYELVSNEREVLYSYQYPSLKNPYKALCSGNFISCIGGFIHKEIYQTHRFVEDPMMIGSEDYDFWFGVLAEYKLGRIDKVNAGIREHPKRSVNEGIYQNLEYQRRFILDKIRKNELLFKRFGRYIHRLSASFYLQQAIVKKMLRQKGKAYRLLLNAIHTDYTILSTLRPYRVLYNILKKS